MVRLITLLIVLSCIGFAWCDNSNSTKEVAAVTPPQILVIQAHPDDETMFGGLIFKAAHDLNATVDIAIITDGAGGYSCSEIAEWIYHEKITDPVVGRSVLGKIRKQEMLASATILNVHNVHFLGEPDVAYTTNVTVVLDSWWDVPLVKYQLNALLTKKTYDYVVVVLPDPTQHGEHKAATVLALEVVQDLNVRPKPIVIGGSNPLEYHTLVGYPITAAPVNSSFTFDRNAPIGNSTTQMVISSWSIAEHKSQGCLQQSLTENNQQSMEYYWYFDINPTEYFQQTVDFFNRLANTPYRSFHRCF